MFIFWNLVGLGRWNRVSLTPPVKIGLELSERHFRKGLVIRKLRWKFQGAESIWRILNKSPKMSTFNKKYFRFFNFSISIFQVQAFVSPERLEILCPSKNQIWLLDPLKIMENSTFSRSDPWFMNGNNKRTVNVPKKQIYFTFGYTYVWSKRPTVIIKTFPETLGH